MGKPVIIESRPSGSHVISVRLPAALAERLLARGSDSGSTLSAVVRAAVEAYLRPAPLSLIPDTGTTSVRSHNFSCQHMAVSGVVKAECGICGPLRAVA